MMHNKVTFLFAGQGSQYYQMGRELYLQLPVFKAHVDWLDHHVQEQAGFSVVQLLYAADARRGDRFDRLRYTHPALFIIQYALARTLMDAGIRPQLVLGLSLGECVALSVAGVVCPLQMLTALLQQSRVLERDCPAGGMLAVLRGPEFFAAQPALFSGSELAAVSTPQLICVAATSAALDSVGRRLKQQQIACERLPLLQPFHSSHLDPLQDRLLQIFAQCHFAPARMAVVSSMQMGLVSQVDPAMLWQIKRAPICFWQTLQHLPVDPAMIFIDVGPGGTLTNFIKHSATAHANNRLYSILSPAGHCLQNYLNCVQLFNGGNYSVAQSVA